MKNNIIVSAELLDQLFNLSEISWRDFVILAQKIDFKVGDSYFTLQGYMIHRNENVDELGIVTNNMKDAYTYMILLSDQPPVSLLESVFEGLASSKHHVQVLAKHIGRRIIEKGISPGEIQSLVERVKPGTSKFVHADSFYRDTLRNWIIDYYSDYLTMEILECWTGATNLEIRAKVDLFLTSKSGFTSPHAQLCEKILREFSKQPAVA